MFFWGITCESGKRYSQVTRQAFHVSMAALEPKDSAPENKFVSLMLEHNGKEFLLCTLNYEDVLQVNLDLQFGQGEELFFFINGEGTIHLSGYIISELRYGESSDAGDSLERFHKSYNNSDVYFSKAVVEQSFSEDDEPGGIVQLLNCSPSDDEVEDEDWNPHLSTRRSRRQVSRQTGYEEELLSLDEDIEEDSYDEEEEEEEEDDDNNDEECDAEEEEAGSNECDEEEVEENECDEEEVEENECDDEPDELVELDVAGPSTSNKKRKKFQMPEPIAKRPKKKDRNVNQLESPGSNKKKTKTTNGPEANEVTVELDDELNSSIGRTPMPKKKVLFKDRPSQSEDTGSPALKMNNSSTPNNKTTDTDVTKGDKEVYSTKLQNGVELQDVRVGNGPVAKKGKFVHVHYVGKLTNGKVFDSSKPGVDKPLSFRLGRSEVISGWDHGIQGMRVGGRRKLRIPPQMAYGKKTNGPIPGNSTLLFTVDLKAVN